MLTAAVCCLPLLSLYVRYAWQTYFHPLIPHPQVLRGHNNVITDQRTNLGRMSDMCTADWAEKSGHAWMVEPVRDPNSPKQVSSSNHSAGDPNPLTQTSSNHSLMVDPVRDPNLPTQASSSNHLAGSRYLYAVSAAVAALYTMQ
jgi:hypothetical protein